VLFNLLVLQREAHIAVSADVPLHPPITTTTTTGSGGVEFNGSATVVV